jgi:hypothetical protein
VEREFVLRNWRSKASESELQIPVLSLKASCTC